MPSCPFYAGNLDFMPQTWCIFVLFSINNLFFMSLFFSLCSNIVAFSPQIFSDNKLYKARFPRSFFLSFLPWMHTLIHCAITACSYKVLFFVYYIIKEPFIFLACTRYQTGLLTWRQCKLIDNIAEPRPVMKGKPIIKPGRRGQECVLSNDLSIPFKLLNGWSLWR